MFRTTLYSLSLVAVLAMAHPVLADPLPLAAADHAQVTAARPEPTASPAPLQASSSDVVAPPSIGHGKDSPVGFGWG